MAPMELLSDAERHRLHLLAVEWAERHEDVGNVLVSDKPDHIQVELQHASESATAELRRLMPPEMLSLIVRPGLDIDLL
jgi:hypothetical protein